MQLTLRVIHLLVLGNKKFKNRISRRNKVLYLTGRDYSKKKKSVLTSFRNVNTV